jgi:hypothetical protein
LWQHSDMLGFILGVWCAAALAVGYSGVLRDVSAPPPTFALLLAIATLAAIWLVPALNTRVRALGIGPLVAIHLTRVVAGINFLILAANGTLPREFALLAGWGDIAVGAAVVPVLMFCVPVRTSGQRLALVVWNTAGLLDILTVLGNGMRLLGKQPELALPFTALPLALLPLFLVPLVICAHLWIFAWTSASDSQPLPSGPVVRPPEEEE